MSNIFIIHSKKDNEIATEISQWLREHGHRSLFLDFDHEKEVTQGRNWEKELNSQLNACQAVIVLCSQHSMSSVWCYSGITHAKTLGKRIIPIVVAPCTISSFLTSYRILDITQDKDIAYEQLDEMLAGVAGHNKTVPHVKYGREAKDKSINVENKKQNLQKPPLSAGRIAGEILAGMGMSFAVMMLVGFVESVVFFGGIRAEADTRMALMSTLSKVTPGLYGIAGAVGVYLLGSRGNETGSLLLTLAFGFFAGLLKLAMFPLVRHLPEMLGIVLFCSFGPLLIVPPIVATIGFNLTRRYKEPLLPQDSGE